MNQKQIEDFGFLDYLDIMWSGKLWIYLSTTLAIIIGLFYAFLATPIYESTSKWLPSTKQENNLSGLAALAGINIGNERDNELVYDEILRSPQFLKALLDKKWPTLKDSITLEELWEFDEVRATIKIPHVNPDLYIQQMIFQKLEEVISYSTAEVLVLKINISDPVLAQSMNQFILNRLQWYNETQRLGQAKRERVFIQKRLGVFENSLEKAENTLLNFRNRNTLVTSPKLLLTQERLLREVEIHGKLTLEFRKQLELAKVEEVKESQEITLVQEPTYPILRAKPRRKIILIGSALIGFFTGCLLSLCSYWWINNREAVFKVLKKRNRIV
jgi:uncharacterized protein involved in exopolysaccharide biosynthesis